MRDAWEMTEQLAASASRGDPVASAILGTRMSMVITDPRQHDNPIVFVNDAFLALTRYSRDEIIGRNCRFLQGTETSKQTVQAIHDALARNRDISVDILNYRKDGSPFWNALYISPVFNEKRELLYFFASQIDATARIEFAQRLENEKKQIEKEIQLISEEYTNELNIKTALMHEVDHRVKNNLQIITSLILMQNNAVADPKLHEILNTILHRIETISAIHAQLYKTERQGYVDFTKIVNDITVAQEIFAAHRPITVIRDTEPAFISAAQSTPLGLIYNEILTNAYKHAFPDDRPGIISIKVRSDTETIRLNISDNGVGQSNMLTGTNTFGQTLIHALCRQTKATIKVNDTSPGLNIEIIAPVDKGLGAKQGQG